MFEAKLVCDANGCHEELDLRLEHPDDGVIEVEKAETGNGWDFDWDTGFSYCPSCKLKVEAECNG
ncbi:MULTISPECIES: hypothetical protein [Vibrio]|uniref:hypothetical protein n=1 Tax=Vibrio TaxID=662 RepID=UPI001120A718|nr:MULTISPECIES: hypothetical protein [Vibrio]MCA2466016.1 hypothetical protein [Vibrio alginolyticus]MDW1564494.1 hypothetical protein [Vibrio sp. YT-15]MDW2194894.1 hypothetical protein [Vibrio sp. 2084]NNN64726.1 hypothetical protein [Vibrio sp. 2-1(7)]TOE82540.1 hypothetical protein CGJ34_15625 [Vibrio parahaemolyticus]